VDLLAGKAVVVTGASSGIGRAIAVRCAAEGARVLAVGRSMEELERTVAAAGDGVVAHRADLAEAGSSEAVVAAAVEAFGGLQGLVHAAGTVRRAQDLREASDEELTAFLDVNLTAAMRLSREALRVMTGSGGGSIVLLGSQLAHIAAPGYPAYIAAKGGITALGRSLAVDFGPHGVRVNVLAPGLVHTPLAYVDRPDFDDHVDAIAERHPLRRIGQPEDMAGPAVFLLSGESAWMTGQTLVVDGGYTIV
jgi:NAD(P)-dependent dehydrogenase (short-subunit alcohol dehydrogenase family)